MCRFTAKFTIRKADQDTNNWYVFQVVHFVGIVLRFPGVHFVGILVPFPGCTLCWYLGTFCWLYILLITWYVYTFSWLCTLLVSETGCIRHLPGSWPRLAGNIHKVTTTVHVMEIFMPLMATGDSLTDVTRGLLWYIEY